MGSRKKRGDWKIDMPRLKERERERLKERGDGKRIEEQRDEQIEY